MATNDYNITSADAVIILTVEDMYPSGIQLQQFSADTAWATEDVQLGEVRMGVDGHLVGGYTPSPVPVTVSLEASSPSVEQLQLFAEAQRVNRKLFRCSMLVTIPSRGKEYQLVNGFMSTAHPFQDGGKTLTATNWQFTFESVKSSTI